MGYFLRRATASLPTAFVAVLAVFVFVRIVPNNPALARLGQHAVPEQVQDEMRRQGWDQPIHIQLGRFVWNFATTGDLGQSFFYSETVAAGLWRTFPATIELALAATLISVPLGIVAGVAAAVWHGKLPDFLCSAAALLGVSIPVFFLGILLMYAFPNLPTGRRLPVGAEFDRSTEFIFLESLLRGRFDIFIAALRHLCLPALALSSIPLALIARITRASMLEVLSADYVRTARAKGGTRWRVVWRHAVPNASIPIVNIAGLQIGTLLTGAVLTESVFDWPGLGRYLVDAVLRSDYAVVQGATLWVAAVFVAANLAVDVAYVLLDPRIRLAGGSAHG